MNIIIIFAFSVILVILLIACIRMYRKLSRYEDWAFSVRKEMYKMLNTMKVLDNKQMFEKDDEVGRLWEAVQATIDKIDEFMVPDGVEDDESDELIIE